PVTCGARAGGGSQAAKAPGGGPAGRGGVGGGGPRLPYPHRPPPPGVDRQAQATVTAGEAHGRTPARLIGCAARIGEARGRADWHDRRPGPWSPGPDLAVGAGGSVTVRGVGERAEQAMAGRAAEFEVLGPWSLETSRRFWEGFTPAALAGGPAGPGLRTVFCAEGDWRRAEAEVTQAGTTVRLMVSGDGDLEAAAAQTCRFLALDVQGRGWPEVGRRDPVIGGAQAWLPGLRPCGFHSPYEAAAWSVLAQRLRIVQAARLRAELIARYGEGGAFPPPHTLARAGLDLPGRKSEYLRAVAEAALDGLLDGAALARPGRGGARPAGAGGRGPGPGGRGGGRAPGRDPPGRAPPPRTPAGHRDRRPVRPRPHPRRSLAGVAALPHLGRRPPACA